MRTSRVTLAALTVATIAFSAPAEARHHRGAQFNPMVDAAAAPAYPTGRQARTRHARSRAVSHRRPAFRLASYPPERGLANERAPKAGTLQAYANAPASVPTPAEAAGQRLVNVQSAAGQITIAASFQHKIVPFIADVVARGFRGRVHCFARGGHVRGSLHYSGNACDFAQTGWGKTRAPMYHVSDLTSKYGLRDGCSFRDCGHIDSGDHLGGRYYAARSHRHHHRRYASR